MDDAKECLIFLESIKMAPSGLTRVPEYCLAVRKALKLHYGDVQHLLDGEHMKKCLVQQLIKGLTPAPFKTVFENLFANKGSNFLRFLFDFPGSTALTGGSRQRTNKWKDFGQYPQ